jgi:hypothetical protein
MRFAAIALASVLAVSSTGAFANVYKHKHHAMHSMNMMRGHTGNPNGTAGGPTTLSGTGSSKFGGSSLGTTGKN